MRRLAAVAPCCWGHRFLATGAESETASAVQKAAEFLRASSNLLFITGAGMSVASGLPTYRGVGGLYNTGEREDGLSIDEALSGPVFEMRPSITWKHLSRLGQRLLNAKPNEAHFAITKLQQWVDGRGGQSWVGTQNVDGLHKAAGNKNILELHGDAMRFFCTYCTARGDDVQESGLAMYRRTEEIPVGAKISAPLCPRCGGVLRPDVVLFEEFLPVKEIRQFLGLNPDCVVAIGTSAMFAYIVEPFLEALREGKPAIEINPQTGFSDWGHKPTVHLQMPAVEAMRALLAELDL